MTTLSKLIEELSSNTANYHYHAPNGADHSIGRVVPAEGGGGQPLGMGQRMGLAGWVTGTRAEGL